MGWARPGRRLSDPNPQHIQARPERAKALGGRALPILSPTLVTQGRAKVVSKA